MALTNSHLSAEGAGWKTYSKALRYQEDIFPPWQRGANNDALNRGVEFTVPEVDVLADFHGDLLYSAG